MNLWTKTRVAYVEDQVALRISLCDYLNSKQDVEVVYDTDNGYSLLAYLTEAIPLPSICILDISMIAIDGLSILKKIRSKWASLPCIIFSMHTDETTIAKAIYLGANGYLSKNYGFEQLYSAIESVLINGVAYTPDADEELFTKVKNSVIDIPKLTERERAFIKHACTELSYNEIAAQMNIATKTVETYRSKCFKKLHVKSRATLVLKAIRLGIIHI